MTQSRLAAQTHQYLIIGGTTKAATTSLFSYLADHPEVCASNIKETRFFLDRDYPVPSKYRFEDGMAKYEEFFCHCCHEKLRLEATPDYLYSSGTPQKIKSSLPSVKLVFILREPVSRLISWYRFAKQNGDLSASVTFDEYIAWQHSDGNEQGQQHLRALQQGRYSAYLKSYLDAFGQDRLRVVFHEDLSRDPEAVVREICVFAGVNPAFYAGYDFQVFNRTETMKHSSFHRVYRKLRFEVRKRTHNKPTLHRFLRRIRLLIEPVYLRLNTHSDEKIVLSPSVRAFLDGYYGPEGHALTDLVARTVPW